jgi:hypothetical protein
MKNFVDLKNYLIKEIKPQENYQYFIFKELINSDGQISYDELANKYDAEYENTNKTDTKSILKDAPTSALSRHGYITSDKNNVYANFTEEPLYYKETISWILEKCLDHWTKNKSIKGLEFREGIIKTEEELEKFCYENNTPRDLVENIILSINRGEKQIILDGPPGTGKTYLIKKIIQFLSNGDSISDLVQFHPSYGYEEFVEGLRPTSKNGSISFEVVSGKLLELLKKTQSHYPISKTFEGRIDKAITTSSTDMGSFYFVAQGGSYEIAKEGSNIWAPNKNARGSEQVDWNLLKQLKIGDLIIHYSENHIRALGRVTDFPKENIQRPYKNDAIKNRENTNYLSWENKEDTLGTLVEVEYLELLQPINKNEFCGSQTINENNITKNSAFDKNGNISQKYLSSLSSDFINFLKESFSEVSELLEKNFKSFEVDILQGFSKPEILTSLNINELPESPGVHLIYYEDTLLYVGETGNTRRRITEHMRSHHASGDTFINHSQKKFGLDLSNDEDKNKFDQLRSNMTIIYKLTEEKEALKNKLIDELKPEYNQKLASVNNSEMSEKTEISKGGGIILQALKNLGGRGLLKDIYQEVNLIDKNIPESSVRRDLQKYSHGSKYYGKQFPEIFRNISSGVWEIVDSYDLNKSIERDILENKIDTVESFGSHDFLIIDEINRGNLPKIFGELLNAFEYRDENISLQYSDKPLSVPSNLIFLGTMNSTDKSVGRMDAAIRRRFDFIHVEPNYEVLHNFYQWNENHVPNLIQGLELLNAELEKKLGKHCLIGHTFFMKSNDRPFMYEDLAKIWDRKIFPLLAEYFLDDPNELETFNSFENFWPIEKKANAVMNNGGKYSLDVLASDLGEINKELELQFNKIVDWSRNYPEFNIYLGRRAVETFKTGGGTFIYQNNLQNAGGDEKDRKYHFFRITGKGKYEIRLMDLYSEKFVRAPFNDPSFREDFELRLKDLFEANKIDIESDFFNKSLPGIPMESLVESQCIDQMLSFWDWVIENINKATSSNG